ncbi:MAG TPA: hydrophobe/amphiphile efflux-1 family RND transporter [Lentisphaeria bacterium]|nr:MAG: RND transporter [Lentisphaerae bacterium GWF2_50_93]HCE44561.1 hydrophobe/amphiphile efflux-1 family RND transporter [Lentisphaeria bacterium]
MISKFFIDHPRFAIVISIVITIAGLISIFSLPVAQYPNITPSQIQITAQFPGADAESVLKTVVEPIEAQVNGVKGMMYISSTSSDDGSAIITVTFPAGTSGDINTVNVQNKVSIAEPKLPAEVKSQGLIVKEKSSNILLVISLYSPNGTQDPIFLANYVNLYIRDEIMRISGVADSTTLGAAVYSMRLWMNPDRMASLGLTASDVINTIKQQNVQVSAGAIGEAPCASDQPFRFTIQTQGRLESVKQFEEIVVKAMPDGNNVKVKDIARVELGAENYNSESALNGKPASLLMVFQLPDANGIQIAQACRKRLEELKKDFPPDIDYGIQYDTTKFIKASIEEVVKTLYEAVFLVILVTFLFLQCWRSTLIPTIAVPVSLIGTFAVLLALGYSINLITLFGLILAIGIVVDDAILVIENVNHLMNTEKLSPRDAARKTMEQVTGPIIATTLVLLAMFIPVCFLPGITGEMYRQFGVTISVAVLISAINALTLSPALCATLLKPEVEGRKLFFIFRWFNGVFDATTKGYSRVAGLVIRKSFIVMVVYAGLMFVSYKIYGLLPTGFIPNEDQGAFMVNVQLPEAASLPRTTRITNTASGMMLETPGMTDSLTTTGYGILTSTYASNNAFIIGVLDDWSKRKSPELSQDSVIRQIYGKFMSIPGAIVMPFNVPAIPGLGTSGGFSFVLQDTASSDPQRLFQAMSQVILEANQRPEITGAFSTFRSSVPRIFLNFDREKALKLGVSIDEINTVLKGLAGYTYINDFNKFGKTYKVEMQADSKYRAELDDIMGLHVRNNKGEMVPINTLVIPETRFGPQYLSRYNLFPSVTINGNAASGFSSGQAMKAMEEVAAKNLPAGMKYEWTDISYQEKLAGNKAAMIFGLALLFIYLFLVAQYESWMIPFSVILSVPIAFFGALVFLLLMGLDNNIYTQVGFVLLFGIACKTAILIVEFAKESHEKGMGIEEAAAHAAKLRFRAVMMTAIAFILGVTPLVVAFGAGAISRRSLGTVVFGGMLVSCIFGTILIPSFFVVIQKMINKFSGSKKT